MSETTIMRTVPATDFKTLHAQISPDPVVELNRRLQMWASVPDADGGALSPSAAIVPDETITAALAEIASLRAQLDEAKARVKTLEMAIAQLPEMPAILNERAARRQVIEDVVGTLESLRQPIPEQRVLDAIGQYGLGAVHGRNATIDAAGKIVRALLSESKS